MCLVCFAPVFYLTSHSLLYTLITVIFYSLSLLCLSHRTYSPQSRCRACVFGHIPSVTLPSEDEACSRDHFIHINSPFGYIASITTRERGYGSLTCPWKITLPHGQRVNLTLIDFSTPEYNRRDLSKLAGVMPYRFLDRDSQCQYPYAILTERWSADRTVRVCGGYQRETHVMLSRTNSVEIRIVTNTMAHIGDEHFFILKYEG